MSELIPHSPGDAISVRAQAAEHRADLMRQKLEVAAKQEELRTDLERQRREMEAEFRRKTAELEAMMAPMQKQLAQMTEILWTVNLYLGRDEEVCTLREGAPAPESTPITLRQKVLAMSEEALVLGLDFSNVQDFTDWLLADPRHLDRVLPEPKGCVVLVPTKVPSDSGNPWEDAGRDQANAQSHWLIRNGERLYMISVDPALHVGDRVLPRRREFADIFDQKLFGVSSGAPVQPGSERWLQLEERADARRRHYMRIMMVLQGVLDRTTIWQPQPAGASFLDISSQDRGQIVLIQDDEDSIQLGDGREPFADYQRRLNAQLRPGLRVIGSWRNQHSHSRDDGLGRVRPKYAEGLEHNVPYLLEDRRDHGFVIRFKRTDMVYRRNVPVPGEPGYVYRGESPTEAKQRASYQLYSDDNWVLPFDLVTVPELERYLASRDERSKHFLSMVPTIRAALDAKRAEAKKEAPFRVLLRGMLLNAGADHESVDELLEDLVHWFKLRTTWCKPLNGDPQHEKRAADQIVEEFRARSAATSDAELLERMVSAGRQLEGSICVARNRQGEWHAYRPTPYAPQDERVYIDVTRIRRNGTFGATRTGQILQQRAAALLHVAWNSEEWDNWQFSANRRQYITPAERSDLVERLSDEAGAGLLAIVEYFNPKMPDRRGLGAYVWTGEDPASAETIPSRTPLDGRVKLISKWVEKDMQGAVRLSGSTNPYMGGWSGRMFRETFGGFDGSPYGSVPWRVADSPHRRAGDPTLVWIDERKMGAAAEWRDRGIAAHEEQQAQREKLSARSYRYVAAVQAIIMERRRDEEREKFVEDYGPNADDLWAQHLAAQHTDSPVHDRTLWGIIGSRIMRGGDPAGVTLAALNEECHEYGNVAPGAWHPTSGLQNLKGYDDIVVPEVDPTG